MPKFADRVLQFNKGLSFTGRLSNRIKVMNPFRENDEILSICLNFYKKFYDDNNTRKIILGINPGRLGAGSTGIPFTDTKRLTEICGVETESIQTHEPSSVFIYELIEKYGGCESFYKKFYINSVCPLGFIEKNAKGNWVNCNYYDHKTLFDATKDFIISSQKKQIQLGIDTSVCYILGKKNAKFFKTINDKEKLFGKMIIFDHPRYIVQYRSKEKERYISEYLNELEK